MGKKYLDDNGLLYLWSLLKSIFAKPEDIPDAYTSNPAMDGTASAGSSSDYAKGDHVHPTDTSRAPTSHAASSDTYGKGTSGNYGHVLLSDATDGTAAAASGGTAATPKAVADALSAAKSYADGAGAGEVNQNAFSNVKVGSTTVEADAKTDTLEFEAGSNVTITPDATNDKITIAATDTTYSAVTSGGSAGLMSGADKTKLDKVVFEGNYIATSILPSSVNDVVEAYARSGETALSEDWLSETSGGSALKPDGGIIYVLMADTTDYAANTQFRWATNTYVKLNDGGVSAITNGEIDTILAS